MNQQETEDKAIEQGIPAPIARCYGYEIHNLVLGARKVPDSIAKLIEEVEYLTQITSALSAEQTQSFGKLKKLTKAVRLEISQ